MESHRSFRLYHLTVSVSWNEDCCSEVEFFTALFPFEPIEGDTGHAAIRVQFETIQNARVRHWDESQCIEAYGLKISQDGNTQQIFLDPSSFVASLKDGEAQIRLDSSFSKQSDLSKSNFFLVGMFQLLLARGFYDLHGAGVVRSDDVGILLLGASGSGKSTAALNLVGNGWRYLSDDALLLRENDHDVEALGFRRNFFIGMASIQQWPNIAKYLDTTAGHADAAKHFVDMNRVYPGSRLERSVPSILLFCSLQQRPDSSIQALSAKDALVQLLAQSASFSFNERFAKQQLTLLKRLVQQTACYQLQAGQDIYHDPSKLSQMLGRLKPKALAFAQTSIC